LLFSRIYHRTVKKIILQ